MGWATPHSCMPQPVTWRLLCPYQKRNCHIYWIHDAVAAGKARTGRVPWVNDNLFGLDYPRARVTARRRGWRSRRRLTYLNNAQRIETFPTVKKKGRSERRLVGWDLVSQKVYHKWQLRMSDLKWGHIEASLCHGSGRSVRPCSQSSGKLFHGSGSPATQGLKLMQLFVI